MSDETQEPQEESQEATDNERTASDAVGLVDADLQTSVMPDSVSLFYVLKPSEGASLENVTAKFVHLDENGLEDHSFAGASTRALLETQANQGFSGDLGADIATFGDYKNISAIVAGVVSDKDGCPHNYYFVKDLSLAVEE